MDTATTVIVDELVLDVISSQRPPFGITEEHRTDVEGTCPSDCPACLATAQCVAEVIAAIGLALEPVVEALGQRWPGLYLEFAE
jgi:hypothetical protein